MGRLQRGWYIILYHDVSWEENNYVRGIGGTCPPDLFRRHVRALSSLGKLVSVEDGHRLLISDSIDEPIISIWFDDGLAGVSKHALPILDEFGVSGAVAICSRFMDRTEFFWRFKLSYLNSIDGIRFLRARLKKYGLKLTDSVKTFTLDHFSQEILEDINALFDRFTTPAQREDAYRVFLDRAAVQRLRDHDWCITNHSGGHYPIAHAHSLSRLCTEFQECDARILEICGRSTYWVLPFDYNSSKEVVRITDACRGDRHLVYVGNRRNTPEACQAERVLYRFSAPIGPPERLTGILSGS
jgi:peptidoglycan/xylan/chitin deacetylase (PgdA/CDA1 family)